MDISSNSGSSGRVPDSARTTVDDLQKRGVKKVSVLTPDKIKQIVERRAAEMMEADKARILAEARKKTAPIVEQNRKFREKIEALTERLEQSHRLLENERTKSFQQGTESQKAVIERYQDEMLALKSRMRELEAENTILLRKSSEQTQDLMTKYRQQMEQMVEDMRALREQAQQTLPARDGGEVLAQYRDEIRQLRESIAGMGSSQRPTTVDADKIAADIEARITARLNENIERIGTAKKSAPVPHKEVVLDNLFKNMPESNTGMVRVRENKGVSISEDLGKLKEFHEGREDLEIHTDETDPPQNK